MGISKDIEPGSDLESQDGHMDRSLSLSMRRKVIISGAVYFSLMAIVAGIVSPVFLELVETQRLVTIWPDSSFVIPHIEDGDISPDGGRIAVATSNGIEIRELQTGTLQRRLCDGKVFRVSWSPDGKKLASVDYDKISVWDPALTAEEPVSCLRFPHFELVWFPDSKRIATISREEESVIIWDTEKEKILHRLRAPKGYRICDTVAVSQGMIATAWSKGVNSTITLWNTTTYKMIHTMTVDTTSEPFGCDAGRFTIREMSWSPDGTVLSYLVANCPGTRHEWYRLDLWEVGRGYKFTEPVTLPLKGKEEHIWLSSYVWSPSGGTIAYIRNMSHTLGIYCLDSASVKEVMIEEGEKAFGTFNRVLGFTPDGKAVAVILIYQEKIEIINTENLQPVLNLTEYGHVICSVAISPDKTILAVLDGWGAVKLLDMGSGRITELLQINTGISGSVRFSNDGEKILLSTDDMVASWNIGTGTFDTKWIIYLNATLPPEGQWDPSWNYPWAVSRLSPDSSLVAIAYVGIYNRIKTIEIRQTETGDLVTRRDLPPVTDLEDKMGGSIIAWSNDQNLIGFTDYKDIFIWNLSSDETTQIGTHPELRAFAFHPQLPLLLSTGKNNETILWDLKTSKPTSKLNKAMHGPIFSPDGSMILDGTGIYNSTTLSLLYKLSTTRPAIGITWDSTGERLITLAPFYGPINIYNLPTSRHP